MMMEVVVALLAAVFVCVIIWLATFKRTTQVDCPGPQASWWTGHLSYLTDVKKIPFVLQEFSQKYGKIFYLQFGPTILGNHTFVISDPDLCEKVLRSNKTSYTISKKVVSQFSTGVGKFAMVCLDGEIWRKHRRMIQPLFGANFLSYSVEIMAKETRSFVHHLKSLPPGSSVEMYGPVCNLLIDIFGFAGFGYDLKVQENPNGPLARAINSALEYFAKTGFDFGIWFYTLLHPMDAWQNQKHRKVFSDLIQSMISNRMKDQDSTGQQKDFLSLMLSATDPDSKYPMSFDEIHDEIITFLFGGFETGAGSLCWFLYHMALNPAIQAKLQEELDEVLGEDGEIPFEKLPQLKYLTNCIKESQRLVPVAPIFSRDAQEDTELGGYSIPKGSMIIINTWTLQHSESNFDNPEKFEPSRWQNVPLNQSFSYFPFGGGSRRCLGQPFAQAEMKVVTALLFKTFTLTLDQTRPVTIDWKITYSPREVFFILKPRS